MRTEEEGKKPEWDLCRSTPFPASLNPLLFQPHPHPAAALLWRLWESPSSCPLASGTSLWEWCMHQAGLLSFRHCIELFSDTGWLGVGWQWLCSLPAETPVHPSDKRVPYLRSLQHLTLRRGWSWPAALCSDGQHIFQDQFLLGVNLTVVSRSFQIPPWWGRNQILNMKF